VTTPAPDLAYTFATRLLAHMLARIEEAGGAAPGRALVSDGDSIPADDCCDGFAWTRVAQIGATDGTGAPYNYAANIGAPVPAHYTVIEIGVLRCTPTVQENGSAPDVEEITAAALEQSADRQAMRLAVECDLPADILELNADAQIPSVWTPIMAGGCAGGFMTTNVITSIVF
jgi:hypothetical protein